MIRFYARMYEADGRKSIHVFTCPGLRARFIREMFKEVDVHKFRLRTAVYPDGWTPEREGWSAARSRPR